MTTPSEEYATMSREFLEKGQEALQVGDLVQASEKLWGAAAQMVKSVAERRGWPHNRHRELFRLVNQIAQETDDPQMRSLFRLADSLHTNFYENWLTQEDLKDAVGQVHEFISKLERV